LLWADQGKELPVRYQADEPKFTIDREQVDWEAVDRATLALLILGVHEGYRTWKSFSWDVMDRLHETDLITDPKSKAKSVLLTDEGFAQAQDLFKKLFYRTE
jgi:preprotein translocase subunit SecA